LAPARIPAELYFAAGLKRSSVISRKNLDSIQTERAHFLALKLNGIL
jgi:hypothetical protein